MPAEPSDDPTPEEVQELWEKWVATRRPPVERLMKGATVRYECEGVTVDREDLFGGTSTRVTRRGRMLISYEFEYKGRKYTVTDMPENNTSRSCKTGSHATCPHRLGAEQEGGVLLKLSPMFVLRCGCGCHNANGVVLL